MTMDRDGFPVGVGGIQSAIGRQLQPPPGLAPPPAAPAPAPALTPAPTSDPWTYNADRTLRWAEFGGRRIIQQLDPTFGDWKEISTFAPPTAPGTNVSVTLPPSSSGVFSRQEMLGQGWNDIGGGYMSIMINGREVIAPPVMVRGEPRYDLPSLSSPTPEKPKELTAFDRFSSAITDLNQLRGAPEATTGSGAPPPPAAPAPSQARPGFRPGEIMVSPSGASIGKLDPRQQPYANVNPATLGFDPRLIVPGAQAKTAKNPLEMAQMAAEQQALREAYATSRPDLSPAEVQSRFFDDFGPGANNNTANYNLTPGVATSKSADPDDQIVMAGADYDRLFGLAGGGSVFSGGQPIEAREAVTPPRAETEWAPRSWPEGIARTPFNRDRYIRQPGGGFIPTVPSGDPAFPPPEPPPPVSWRVQDQPPPPPLPAPAPAPEPRDHSRGIEQLLALLAGGKGLAGGGTVVTDRPTFIGPAGGPPAAVASEFGQPEMLTQTAPNAVTVTPMQQQPQLGLQPFLQVIQSAFGSKGRAPKYRPAPIGGTV